MKLKELIGKKAIRTAPVSEYKYQPGSSGWGWYGSGSYTDVPNYAYCSEPVTVLAATDTNAIVTIKNFEGKEIRKNLSCLYCDDNWCDYEELENSANLVRKEQVK